MIRKFSKGVNVTTGNIFSDLKVVDLASFIAGPGAAVIPSDFGADVIKVEPPSAIPGQSGTRFPLSPARRTTTPGI